MSSDTTIHELLFQQFRTELARLSVLCWDSESDYLGQNITNLEIGLRPVFVFCFSDVPEDINEHSLLIGENVTTLTAKVCANTAEEFRAFAYPMLYGAVEHLEEVNYQLQDITHFISPFDVICGLPIQAKRVSLVTLTNGTLAGILIWFQNGVNFGLAIGGTNEVAPLFNDHVDAAYKNALEMQALGNLTIQSRDYPILKRYQGDFADVVRTYGWFNW